MTNVIAEAQAMSIALADIADDPMWTDHAEISKARLRAASDILRRAVLALAAPAEGYKLVPIEPTPEMVQAACTAHDEKPLSDWGRVAPANDEEIYRAMLDAAPAAPKSDAAQPVAGLTIDRIAGPMRAWPDHHLTLFVGAKNLPVGDYKLYASPPPSAAGQDAELRPAIEGLIEHATEEGCGECSAYIARIRAALAAQGNGGGK